MRLFGIKVLDTLIEAEKGPILIYGEAGAGKTAIVLQAVANASRAGMRPLYIGTEGFASYAGRAAVMGLEGVVFADTATLEKEAEAVLRAVREGFNPIVIDSVNSLYRLEDDIDKASRYLSAVMSILRGSALAKNTYSIVTGQVHFEGEEASGMHVLRYWAPVIVRLEKELEGRTAYIVKPGRYDNIPLRFRITRSGVVWES